MSSFSKSLLSVELSQSLKDTLMVKSTLLSVSNYVGSMKDIESESNSSESADSGFGIMPSLIPRSIQIKNSFKICDLVHEILHRIYPGSSDSAIERIESSVQVFGSEEDGALMTDFPEISIESEIDEVGLNRFVIVYGPNVEIIGDIRLMERISEVSRAVSSNASSSLLGDHITTLLQFKENSLGKDTKDIGGQEYTETTDSSSPVSRRNFLPGEISTLDQEDSLFQSVNSRYRRLARYKSKDSLLSSMETKSNCSITKCNSVRDASLNGLQLSSPSFSRSIVVWYRSAAVESQWVALKEKTFSCRSSIPQSNSSVGSFKSDYMISSLCDSNLNLQPSFDIRKAQINSFSGCRNRSVTTSACETYSNRSETRHRVNTLDTGFSGISEFSEFEMDQLYDHSLVDDDDDEEKCSEDGGFYVVLDSSSRNGFGDLFVDANDSGDGSKNAADLAKKDEISEDGFFGDCDMDGING